MSGFDILSIVLFCTINDRRKKDVKTINRYV